MPAAPTQRIPAQQRFWTGGANSLLNPADIAANQYAWAENIINRGGIVQTRPGYKLLASIPGTRLQGIAMFSPRNSSPSIMAAVDGVIYQAKFPSLIFEPLEDVSFSAEVPIIHFCQAWQSVKRNPDGSLTIVNPYRIMMISDNATKTASWDGVSLVQMNPVAPYHQTPACGWMVWTSGALWFAQGTKVRVSDLGNPTSMYEDQFLATRSKFEMPGVVTGMIETANERGLLAFTDTTTTVFKSFVRDRSTWGATPDFQKLVFPSIGCDAGLTACNQYGLTYWHSRLGMVSLDAAMNTDHTSKLLAIDGQMMRSKRNLSPDMSGACAAAFENLLLISVPSGGKYNEQTWVLDQSPLENLLDSATAWPGVWTGTRPVQFTHGEIAGRNRLIFGSYDRTPVNDTHIHIWEAIRSDRKDAGGRIKCQVQFPVVPTPDLRKFRYAEFEVVEMLGEVSLSVFVCGTRGPWIELATYELRAQEGSIGAPGQVVLTGESQLRAFKPQSRTLRTPEFSEQDLECSPEYSGKRPGIDKGFSLLFEWTGRMGIRGIRMTTVEATESDKGNCTPAEGGEPLNIVYETGETP